MAPTAAPVGDPPRERAGTIPMQARAGENTVIADAIASSPQQALRRYALAYTNWRAGDLRDREQQLAATSVGAAKLTAEQTAAQQDRTPLIDSRVANAGTIVAITRGEGPDVGWWVIVTREHTTGTGAYAGLPPATHVTLARVARLRHGWVVSAWNSAS